MVFALCGTHINISHGGVSDVRKHLATAKHQQMVQAEGESMDLRKMISLQLEMVLLEQRFYLVCLLLSTIFPIVLNWIHLLNFKDCQACHYGL